MSAPIRIGPLEIGLVPCVVGVARRPDFFSQPVVGAPPCDCMEVRVDLAGSAAEGWLRSAQSTTLRARVPLLLTIRCAQEGGRWTGNEAERVAAYRALMSFVDAVDVELESEAFPSVAEAARASGLCVIGSFHDFASTPDSARMQALVDLGERGPAHVIKLATWTQTESDVGRLEAVLRAKTTKPVAVMGMGPLGAAARLRLAAAGSALVYGFLDEASAPGQLSSAELVQRLSACLPHYRAARAREPAT